MPESCLKKLYIALNVFAYREPERIFMCLWNGNHFVMLSHYTKDADETDELELARARRLRDNYLREHPIEDLTGEGKLVRKRR